MPFVVVTGGASGLGRAIAAHARNAGWTVALLDRDHDSVLAAADELGGAALTADVTEPEQLAEAFAAAVSTHGAISGLVNAAGLTRPGPSESLAVADWKTVVDVDLSGTFYTCQAAFPHLAPEAGIVNIASIASVRGLPQRAAYSAAKAGVVGLTRALAVEWASHGVRVNAVGPSWVDTPLLRGLVESGSISEEEMVSKVPLGRLCRPEEVADSVMYLLAPDSARYITGQTLYIDGGYVWAG